VQIEPWMLITAGVLVVGIIFLGGKSLFRSKSRQQYLDDLAMHLKSKFIPLEGFENGYAMKFHFEGFDFEFLDLEDSGFRDDLKSHKAFLKTRANSDLTLSFTERGRVSLKSEAVRVSDIRGGGPETVEVPKQLKEFSIYSNRPMKANEFFRQEKVVDVFNYLKSVDSRGHANIPLSLQDGEIVIQFFSSATRKPSIFDLKHSTSKIEDYLDDLIILSKAINKTEEKFKI